MTTDQQPAGRELAVVPAANRTPSREVATTDTDSWIGVLQNIGHLAELICGTEFVPKNLRNSAPATAAAIMYGREVGLPPMTALTQTHVIEGKPAMSAEAMRAMILAAGHELAYDEVTGAICRMRARRAGSDNWTELAWTIDMARAAGLTGKDNWKKYPRAMLISRCTADLARMVFPDVIHGFRSLEEVQDLDESAPDEAGGAEVPAGTSKVARKRTTKKAAAVPAPSAPPQLAGPPLPGEAGYDEPAPETEGGASSSTSQGVEQAGEAEAPPSTDAPGSDAAGDAPEASPEGAGADPGAQDSPAEPEQAGESTPDEKPAPRPLSRAQQRMIMSLFGGLEIAGDKDREERLLIASAIVGRELESTNDLMSSEAKTLIDTLSNVEGSREKLNVILDTIDEANAQRARAEGGDDD